MCTVNLQVESALPLSPLLLGVQFYMDRYFQGCREEDPVFDISGSLIAFKRSCCDQPEREHGFSAS